MKPAEWIDRVKAARGWESDYRVAKELGISRQSISGYRSGKYTLDEETAVSVAEALGILPGAVLFDQMRERAKSDKVKAAFTDALKKLGGVAASSLLAVGLVGTPSEGRAGKSAEKPSTPVKTALKNIHRI